MVYTPCLVTNKVFFSSNLEVMRQQQPPLQKQHGRLSRWQRPLLYNGGAGFYKRTWHPPRLLICCNRDMSDSDNEWVDADPNAPLKIPEWSVAGAAQGHRALFTQRRRLISGQQLGRRVTRRCAVGSDLNCI